MTSGITALSMLHAFCNLQMECLPIFCPMYEMEVGGKCVPLVREIQASSIQLDLYTHQLPESVQVNRSTNEPTDQKWNPTFWVRSPCREIKWGHMSVFGVVNDESDEIRFFRFYMTKKISYNEGFVVRKFLAAMETCWRNDWELLVHDQWQPVAVTIGREQETAFPTRQLKLWTSSREEPDITFQILKLMLCPQVIYILSIIIEVSNKYNDNTIVFLVIL